MKVATGEKINNDSQKNYQLERINSNIDWWVVFKLVYKSRAFSVWERYLGTKIVPHFDLKPSVKNT